MSILETSPIKEARHRMPTHFPQVVAATLRSNYLSVDAASLEVPKKQSVEGSTSRGCRVESLVVLRFLCCNHRSHRASGSEARVKGFIHTLPFTLIAAFPTPQAVR
ncbi:hypothetical protein JTE90_007420 [Oedothorax gibbosus]|uniref:Uncharacterized protein n=1 Tax=Oedothorax gibbosus TaxID=931172 RepID=A0AAV6TJH2_9ARAC|nr:hypothetical protein JTE90_007420 [Oedothorax gibbosus]